MALMKAIALTLSWAAIWMLLSLPVTGVHLHLDTHTSSEHSAPSHQMVRSEPSSLHVVHAFDAEHSHGLNVGEQQDVEPEITPLGKFAAAILIAIAGSLLIRTQSPVRSRLRTLSAPRPPLRYSQPPAQAPPSPI
nr:hypothetical protein [Oceanococcus sp. HetDA_MAG_MS8]